jgi:LPXTG-motif cell wall-anchored protein
MRSIRRAGGVAIAGLLLSAMVSGAAGAQTTTTTPASYTGSATGYALKLALGPQNLTAGSSEAKAASDGTGAATGAGVISVPASPVQASTLATIANPPGGTVAEKCGDDQLNAVETALQNIIKLGLGCGSAAATGTGAASVASATGKVAELNLNISPIAQAIPVTPQLVGGVEQITTTVEGVCAALPTTPVLPLPTVCQSTTNTLDTLVESIVATSLLNGQAGSSDSGVSATATTVTTESTASGAVIRIVPTPVLDQVTLPEALITITIARANAKVVCDLGNGTATPSFDPAIVRVKLGAPLAGVLPLAIADPIPANTLPANPIITGISDPKIQYQNGELTVTPGSTVTLLPGTPAETEIVVGNGTAKVNPDGSATASADGVKVHALKNIGTAVAPLTGGLLVNLAHAEAAGGCVAATSAVAPPAPAVPEVTRELPRTGGNDVPWLPIAGVAGLALAVMSRRAVLRTR